MVSERVGEGSGDAGDDENKLGFKIEDGAFSYIAAMDIWRDKLEGAVPLVNNGAAILGASLIVEDL